VKIYFRILGIRPIKLLLAIVISIMIVNIYLNHNTYGYYNKIATIKLPNFLSYNITNLIITTVSGDKRYEDSFLSDLYKDLQITHLLVLSGSNLVIVIQLISIFFKKNSFSSYIIFLLTLILYFCYTNYLHPIARALIFMILYEFISCFGIKNSSLLTTSMLLFFSINFYFLLGESLSFLLSATFAILIVLYNKIFQNFTSLHPILSKFVIFPVYMSLSSIPVNLYFFNSVNFLRIFISNLFITPFYDLFCFVMYIIYILIFIPFDLSTIIHPLYVLIFLFLRYLVYINELLSIYNV